MDKTKVILIDHGIDKKGIHLVLDYYLNNSISRKKKYIYKESLTIEKGEHKHCIGSYDINKNIASPCPTLEELEKNKLHCKGCLEKIGFNPFFYNVSRNTLSKQQLEYNDKQHRVYIAGFDKSVIKVGIAFHKRTFRRLLEQGARAAIIIKTCNDVYEARRIERKISETFDIPERVTTRRKQEAIVNKTLTSEIIDSILKFREELFTKTTERFEEGQVYNFDKIYIPKSLESNKKIVVSEEKEVIVSGKILGKIGSNLIVECKETYFITDIKKSIGYEIIISDKVLESWNEELQREQLTIFDL